MAVNCVSGTIGAKQNLFLTIATIYSYINKIFVINPDHMSPEADYFSYLIDYDGRGSTATQTEYISDCVFIVYQVPAGEMCLHGVPSGRHT